MRRPGVMIAAVAALGGSLGAGPAVAASFTFGTTSVGTTANPMDADTKVVNLMTSPSSGKLKKVEAYLDGKGAASGSQKVRAIVYAVSGGVPGARLGQSNEVTVNANQAAGWVTFTFPSAVSIPSGSVGVGLFRGATSRLARVFNDTAAGTRKANTDTYSDGATDPFGAVGTTTNALLAIRVTAGDAYEWGVSIPCDRICYETAANKDAEFVDVVSLGATWVRIDLRWSVIENTGPGQGNWSAFDDTVTRARAHGLKVLPVIHSTPNWANGGIGHTYPPTNTSDWSNFINTAATHLLGQITAYEIWNEPNLSGFFGGTVAQYTALLNAAYTQIKAVDSSAKVLTGGLAPGGDYTSANNSVKYLEGIYANGGGGHFDAVANHPYTGGTSNSNGTEAWNNWYQMFGGTHNMVSVLASNGDSAKQIWGTEWGYSLLSVPPAANEGVIQANIPLDVGNWRSYSWSGPLFWYSDRDDGSTGYGLSDATYPLVPRPRWTTLQTSFH